MHYHCKHCEWEKEVPHMTHEVMKEIFVHEKTHLDETLKPEEEKTDG